MNEKNKKTEVGLDEKNINTSTNDMSEVKKINQRWSRDIPIINRISTTLIIILIIVGFYVFFDISKSDDSRIVAGIALSFLILQMIYLFAGIIFNGIENSVLSKKYSNSESKLDSWLFVSILSRNIFIILSAILTFTFVLLPHLILILMFIYIPYIIIYLLLVYNRSVISKRSLRLNKR